MLATPALLNIPFHPPTDFGSNYEIILRWIHFAAAITWIGLLYFFNLVNMPLQKQLDAPTKAKMNPTLLSLSLWWFRWGAVVTVLAGIVFWSRITVLDARNHGYSAGSVFGSFFLVWTLAFVIEQGVLMAGKGALNNGVVLTVIFVVILVGAAVVFLEWNSQVENNRVLAIGVGGGLGWFMLLNVWGIVWRANKRLIAWTRETSAAGPMPDKLGRMMRQAFIASRANFVISFPLLFFMGAASHYPLFGR
ncbi:MAG: hypothetical protein WA188_22280 [Terriglobales bacterium]